MRNSVFYPKLIPSTFCKIINHTNTEDYKYRNLSEIIKIDKIEKHETFEKVLDGSGYIFEVYYENTEIKKIIKKYWVAYAPNYEREEQYSETIYYLNNQYVQKWIQDSDAKWNFNLGEKEGKALQKTVLTLREK